MMRGLATAGAEQFAEELALSTSGAKGPREENAFIAALKRCATQNLLLVLMAAFCSAPLQAQSSAPSAAPPTPGPRADVVYLHGNVYTGVPANSQFSSIQREEAIAVREGRIQAVIRPNVDLTGPSLSGTGGCATPGVTT